MESRGLVPSLLLLLSLLPSTSPQAMPFAGKIECKNEEGKTLVTCDSAMFCYRLAYKNGSETQREMGCAVSPWHLPRRADLFLRQAYEGSDRQLLALSIHRHSMYIRTRDAVYCTGGMYGCPPPDKPSTWWSARSVTAPGTNQKTLDYGEVVEYLAATRFFHNHMATYRERN